MGSKNKLKRFKENLTFDNVIQPERNTLVKNEFHIKANWNKLIFKNNFPIVLEIGCGKGEYDSKMKSKAKNQNKEVYLFFRLLQVRKCTTLI